MRSPLLTAIGLVNGKLWEPVIFDPNTLTNRQNFVTGDYVNDFYSCGPLSSDRQYLSYGVCLKVRGEIIRTVLCCIVYDSCAQS